MKFATAKWFFDRALSEETELATDEHRSNYSAKAATEGYPQITQIFADSDKASGMSDIEGKPHGKAVSESGNGASFKHRLGRSDD